MELIRGVIIIAMLLTLLVVTSKGQKASTIKGIVIDKGGNPLVGCNVIIKGTFTGTVTDSCGQFSLPIGQEDFTILFHDMAYEDLRTFELELKIEKITVDRIVFQIGSSQKKRKECTRKIDKRLVRYRIR